MGPPACPMCMWGQGTALPPSKEGVCRCCRRPPQPARIYLCGRLLFGAGSSLEFSFVGWFVFAAALALAVVQAAGDWEGRGCPPARQRVRACVSLRMGGPCHSKPMMRARAARARLAAAGPSLVVCHLR